MAKTHEIKYLKKVAILGAIDLFMIFSSYAAVLVLALLSGKLASEKTAIGLILSAAIVILSYFIIFGLLKVNMAIWRYASETAFLRIIAAALIDGFVSTLLMYVFRLNVAPLEFYVLAVFVSCGLLLLSRICYKLYSIRKHARTTEAHKNTKIRILIVGAGYSGLAIMTEIRNNSKSNLEPVGFVDDSSEKYHRSINGVEVLGNIEDIEKISREKQIEKIFIAIPSATNAQRARILDECAKTDCEVKILPMLTEFEEGIDGKRDFLNKLREITPEELLGRETVFVANEEVLAYISGKTVCVTGGGGSIGSELARQIAAHSPKKLVIIDIYENNAYSIQQELLLKHGKSLNLQVYIASVREFEKINFLFEREKPDIVFHAAAHKHVPLMEVSPDEAVKNNIFGTFNTARAAMLNGVKRFILISTDKAVNPTNIMGATKRTCEMVIQYFNKISDGKTTYAAVRFGNVLGSNGSVIPLFKKQIKERQDLTVTDPRIIRYFMTIPEASQLVLAAGAMAGGGEIFVLDMGDPVKIDDLAKKMIKLSGLTLGKDINIRYIGLRPGEKLYEELLMSEEGLKSTLNKKIFISKIMPIDFDAFIADLECLKKVVTDGRIDSDGIEKHLKHIVPTFNRYIPEKAE